ncbi:MAG: hypothetical protein OEM94_01525 [Acidimicrobiia bacterium]|nr:hypothetical protein [Acidimicrobiia bacterium]MDH3469975.1 hypothetical protein [Acidimicrobiia bacterium]
MQRFIVILGAFAIAAAACASETSSTASESTDAPGAVAPVLEDKGPITSAEDVPPAKEPTATSAPAGEESPDAATATPVASDLPSVEVIDLADDTTFNVASLVPSDRPIVLWFWAPH